MNKTFNFNKELLIGEIGATICAPLLSYIVSRFTTDIKTISESAVAGAILGASIFWLITRIYDEETNKEFSASRIAVDIAYFTPAAFIITLLVYYPVLYLLSHKLLINGHKVILSVIPAQIAAFILFLICINIYRLLLYKLFKKEL